MYKKFEQLLQKHKVTAYRVAKETGISTATLSDWKNGKSTPKPDKIKKIADFFGESLAYFYNEDNNYNATTSIVREDTIPYNVAAHREGDIKWTEDELRKIEEFKQLLLAARKNK